MKILLNNIGFEPDSGKTALLACSGEETPKASPVFYLMKEGEICFEGKLSDRITVPGWKGRSFYSLDFSPCTSEGIYTLRYSDSQQIIDSLPFRIERGLLAEYCLSDILFYFKSQRASWRWNEADKRAPFVGERKDRVDVSGGWYDASGDYSKYLSHLSYANYMNPQQTPLVTWALYRLGDVIAESQRYGDSLLQERSYEEACHGADFLMRMQDPDGYFYITLFDTWSKDTEQRKIAAFRGKEGILMENYQAGFRQGAGMAIASLAKASCYQVSGEFTSKEYLAAAVRGWDHLLEHNRAYLDNGRENIIDHYCALMAAMELFEATEEDRFFQAAIRQAEILDQLYDRDLGYWRCEKELDRPYFHAAEAGLPIMALQFFSELAEKRGDSDQAEKSRALVRQAVEDLIAISKGEDNPFKLMRQWIKPVSGEVRTSFFVPHDNETGYWWQGENARLASLSCALRSAAASFDDKQSIQELSRFADAQIDWILGKNPFAICMLQGHGQNNPRYEDHYPNAPGGICNGITAGYEDENDLDFLPAVLEGRGDHRWRWSEQWIPHAAWFLLAIAADKKRWKRQ